MDWFVVVFLAINLIVSVLVLRAAVLRTRLHFFGGDMTLQQKVLAASSFSHVLKEMNEDIQKEFNSQSAETERLMKEAMSAQQIAALNKEGLEAAETLIERSLARRSRPERMFQVVLAVGGAAVGIVATLIIQAITGA